MHMIKKGTLWLGRAALSLIFILSAIQKIFTWRVTEDATLNQVYQWSSYPGIFDWVHTFTSEVVTWIPLLLILHIALELVGGVLVFLGIKVKLGALLLILALIPATLLFHNFWMLEGDNASLQMIMFLKNLSILGGLLILTVMGSVKNAE